MPHLPGPSDAQAVLTVDLDALAANWRLLAARAAPAATAAVVKADAYGIGIAKAVPALAKAGCRTFFVAHVAEGVRARNALRGAGLPDTLPVFVLNGYHPALAPPTRWAAAALSPVIGSPHELAAWRDWEERGALPAALHVDTGMNRFGFTLDAAEALPAEALAEAGITLLMSHFVIAEDPADPINDRQIARFEALRQGPLGAVPASLANSSGIFLPSRPHYDLVRPGYALYGGNPTPSAANPMRPVVRLTAPILQLRDVAAGDTVGYGARWTARRPTRLATIGVGYADGLPRNAQSVDGKPDGPAGLLDGIPCPLVGRVSMDLTLVDVTDAPAAQPGAELELLGPTLTVDDLGAACQTIGYEILTRLGRRYARTYLGG